MKFLLDQLEKWKPLFEPGGKLEKLYPLYEAKDTFMFTPPDVTKGGPHVRDGIDLKRLMITVVVALIPATLFGMWNAGHQYNVVSGIEKATLLGDFLRGACMVLPIILTSYIAGGVWEVLFAVVRKHEINEGFLVTGLLFPLTLPPTIPLWQVAVGISFGVIVGKEVFGGTGFNILNPALTARAFCFFAYPVQISGDTVWTKLAAGSTGTIEGFTGATPLAVAAQAPLGSNVVELLRNADYAGFGWGRLFLGNFGGSIAETSALAALIGAAILLVTGVASWRIMLGGVLGVTCTSLLLGQLDPTRFSAFTQLPFYYHLVMGGFAFGIVFMATDPVSAAATNEGKWVYGFMIGLLTVVIRVANPAYPEGVMLSILFMNVMAPLIDHVVLQFHIRQRQLHLRKFSYAKG
jgi:Na+-transporting NADH:ubiquinone oxidoreductase subunit B